MKSAAISALLALVPMAAAHYDFRLVAPYYGGAAGQATSSATAQSYAAVGPSGAITTSTATAASAANTFRLMPDGTVQIVSGQAASQCISSSLVGPSGALAASQCTSSAQRFTVLNNYLIPLNGDCLYYDNSYFRLSPGSACNSLGAVAGARIEAIGGVAPIFPQNNYFFSYDKGSDISASEFAGLEETNWGTVRLSGTEVQKSGAETVSNTIVGLGIAALAGLIF